MIILNDDKLLNYYIKKHEIETLFDTDMKQHMTLVQYDRGEDILVAGDSMPYFFLIVEGKAKIFRTLENGKSVLLRFTRPLSELGSLELLHEKRIVDSEVQSIYGVTAIRIPFEDLEEVTKHDVTFLRYIVSRLSTKLETASKAASLNASYPFKNRFASYLISLTRIDSVQRIDEINFDKLTDLATFLGTSYRHLNRVIQTFEKEGMIVKKDKKFIILDYQKLEDLAGGYYE
ncbi:MAG: helix-turn-helix domain-containing protein [Clostridiales bacterium]|nr:helix-turn-helix domain-containing protein [Clostridiales bacterium]